MSKNQEFFDRNDPTAMTDHGIVQVHNQLDQQKTNPAEGFSVMPIVLMSLSAALIFLSGVHMAKGVVGFDVGVFDPQYVAPAVVVETEINLFKMGKKLFARNCINCHQGSGLGLAGVFPPLADSQWVLGSEERLVKLVWNGLQGVIQVKGESYNGIMPAFEGLLTELQMAAVLTYIRQEWGNNASEISLELATQFIASIKGRGSWNSEELLLDHPIESP